MNAWFDRFATRIAHESGSSRAFMLAAMLVATWALLGPLLGYSNRWQLMANTGTTIITFLMVFILQHTQMRDTTALHAKVDEVIRSLDRADNSVIGMENDDAGE